MNGKGMGKNSPAKERTECKRKIEQKGRKGMNHEIPETCEQRDLPPE
jgi:hypothetical protein